MKDKRIRNAVSLLFAFCVLSLNGCAEMQNEMLQADKTLFAMNTYMTLLPAHGEEAGRVLDEVQERVLRLKSLWSVTQENSDIYRANHSDRQTVSVSEETAELISFALEMADEMADETAGAIDLTVYPVLTAWGIMTNKKQVPSKQELEQQLSLVDHIPDCVGI